MLSGAGVVCSCSAFSSASFWSSAAWKSACTASGVSASFNLPTNSGSISNRERAASAWRCVSLAPSGAAIMKNR